MKLGLITIYSVPNHGSVLQAFATQKILEALGHECNIINYKYPNHWNYAHGYKRTSLKSKVASFFLLSPNSRKQRKLNRFRTVQFNFTRLYNDWNDLHNEDWSMYDCFIVGSDQVWNPRFLHMDPTFMLSFLPDSKKRISIASSFSVASLSRDEILVYKKLLEKFSSLSVREENGVNIIRNQLNLNNEVSVILDPTLLLSREDWLKLFPKSSKPIHNRKYILYYELNYAFTPRPKIQELAKYYANKMNYDIIALQGYEKELCSDGYKVINAFESSIEDFISLFANASMVVTSSFHGTAFALIFGIPLASIVPDANGDDRQTNLLQKVGAVGSIVTQKTKIDEVETSYDNILVNNKINKLREISINWIKRSLE